MPVFSTGRITVSSYITKTYFKGGCNAYPNINKGTIKDTSDFMPTLLNGQIALKDVDGNYTSNFNSWTMEITQNINLSMFIRSLTRGNIPEHEKAHVRSTYLMAIKLESLVKTIERLNKELSSITDAAARSAREHAYLQEAKRGISKIFDGWKAQNDDMHGSIITLWKKYSIPQNGW